MSSKKASISEFSIIEKYFSNLGESKGVSLGVGDDCAILEIPPDNIRIFFFNLFYNFNFCLQLYTSFF